MSKFLRALLKISLWEVSVIVLSGGIKYLLVTYSVADKISKPFIWVCFVAALLFLTAIGVMGRLEDKGETIEEWEAKARFSRKAKLLVTFVTWAQLIPIAMGYLLFIYLIAPTTLFVLVAFIVGIILRNSIQYFRQKGSEPIKDTA